MSKGNPPKYPLSGEFPAWNRSSFPRTASWELVHELPQHRGLPDPGSSTPVLALPSAAAPLLGREAAPAPPRHGIWFSERFLL